MPRSGSPHPPAGGAAASRCGGVVALVAVVGCACVFGACRPPAVRADDGHAPRTVRLLTVGNSLSQDGTRWLGQLARAAGHVLEQGECAVGGASLADHCGRAEAFARDHADPAGRYPTGRSLVEELRTRPWDVVTIQQVSTHAHDVATFSPHAGRLRDLVAEHAPTARLWLHETWEYRADSPRFAARAAGPGEPRSAEDMHRGIRAAYRAMSAALDAPVIPAGDAFHLALAEDRFRHRVDAAFDPARAIHPRLPDQSGALHVGWTWKQADDGRWKLALDDRHASLAGAYLAGCVWLESLFDESSVGNPFVPSGLDPADARRLQEIAHRAVAAGRREPALVP